MFLKKYKPTALDSYMEKKAPKKHLLCCCLKHVTLIKLATLPQFFQPQIILVYTLTKQFIRNTILEQCAHSVQVC